MKRLDIILILITLVVAAALFWMHGNLDSLIRSAIAKYGSEMIQAKVSVESVKINATSGEGTVNGLTIGNPKGFKAPYAMRLKEFTVAIDPISLTKEVVTVKKIIIDAPDVIYEKGNGLTNFDAIQKNISEHLGPSDGKSPGKKLVVEEFTLRNVNARVSAPFMGDKMMSIDLPDITLRNLGKAKGGGTPEELGQEVVGAMKRRLVGAVNFDKLGKTVKDAAKSAKESVSDTSRKMMSWF